MKDELPLPLTAALFQVLVALSDGDKHGYAILKEVEEQSGGEVRLSTGTLYGIIKRLLTDGMIVEVRQRPPAEDDDSRRRYYRLTPWGRQVAAAEAERMEKAIAAARVKRLLKRPVTT
ncbi:MAG: PadR family transcriptional regulator [Acidobacteriia bacterium]|nr:PadR family transcriptional regulator [Terriglobia bacterium]